jgi:hypothetical protein
LDNGRVVQFVAVSLVPGARLERIFECVDFTICASTITFNKVCKKYVIVIRHLDDIVNRRLVLMNRSRTRASRIDKWKSRKFIPTYDIQDSFISDDDASSQRDIFTNARNSHIDLHGVKIIGSKTESINIIGCTDIMLEIYQECPSISITNSSVIITGNNSRIRAYGSRIVCTTDTLNTCKLTVVSDPTNCGYVKKLVGDVGVFGLPKMNVIISKTRTPNRQVYYSNELGDFPISAHYGDVDFETLEYYQKYAKTRLCTSGNPLQLYDDRFADLWCWPHPNYQWRTPFDEISSYYWGRAFLHHYNFSKNACLKILNLQETVDPVDTNYILQISPAFDWETGEDHANWSKLFPKWKNPSHMVSYEFFTLLKTCPAHSEEFFKWMIVRRSCIRNITAVERNVLEILIDKFTT